MYMNGIRGVSLENYTDDKIRIPREQIDQQIAMMILASQKIVAINFNDNFSQDDTTDSLKLAVYMTSGEYEGIYVSYEDFIDKLIVEYRKDISRKSINDIKRKLSVVLKRILHCNRKKLIQKE